MDPDLLGNLLDQLAAALEPYARQWCDVPEDVVQDAFLRLAAQRALPDNPAAWLFRVVRNGAIDAGQAARRRKRYETAAASWAPPWFEADPDERPGVEGKGTSLISPVCVACTKSLLKRSLLLA
jgi:DNA-directed RNA polymerase specialized sigma24 family protein